ncbi:hypothetical protein TNCV_3705411 [Trichonephila clavipes]|nr:hypothetical protein TNCV_3705411 [Trichonephila clavipes]
MPDATKYPPSIQKVSKPIKSMGLKVLWEVSAETTGAGEYFPPLQFHAEIVKVEIVGVAIYRKKKSSMSPVLATFIPSLREGHDN